MTYRAHASGLSLSVAARSETGPCRDRNEDTFQILDLARGASFGPPAARAHLDGPAFVLGVYDGCGHGEAGVASDLAAAEIQARMCGRPIPEIAVELARRLGEAVMAANRAILGHAAGHPRGAGMGTTLTVAGLRGDSLVLAQVGDTRAYLLREERLVQLTRDHTLIEDVRKVLALSPAEAAALPAGTRAMRDLSPEQLADLPGNVITRAVGVMGALAVDLSRCALCRGDRLLLCTDGLSALVDAAAIAAAVRVHADPYDACAALVASAVRAGGHDNITILVADVDGDWLNGPLPGGGIPVAEPMMG